MTDPSLFASPGLIDPLDDVAVRRSTELVGGVEPLIGEPGTTSSGRRRRRRPLLVLSATWLGVVLAAAIAAGWLPLADPGVDVGHGLKTPPFHRWAEPLGTDALGRSVLSRFVFGARVSLGVGVVATLLAMIVGGSIGLVAGYVRGRVDTLIGIGTDAALAFPPLVLLLAIAAVTRPNIPTLAGSLAVISVPAFIRLSRANTLRVADRQFVVAARLAGAQPRRIMFREVLPNIAPPVIAYAMVVVAVLIIAESVLSFLGLGVPPPTPSWGVMVADGRNDMQSYPFLVFIPAIGLSLTVFSINVVGDWLRKRHAL